MRDRCQSVCTLVVAAVGLGPLGGCGGPRTEPGHTPQATFEAFKLALQDKDFDRLWNLMDESGRNQWIASIRRSQAEFRTLQKDADQADAKAKQQAQARLAEQGPGLEEALGVSIERFTEMEPKSLFVLIWKQTARDRPQVLDGRARATFLRQDIQGDRATVTYRRPDGREADVAMVLANGLWKVGPPSPK